MSYQPGDVANGHVLGTDNQWHPLGAAPGAPRRRSYWERYRARYKATATVVAVLSLLGAYGSGTFDGNGVAVVIDLLLRVVGTVLVLGSLVNLVVAAFPDRRPRRAVR